MPTRGWTAYAIFTVVDRPAGTGSPSATFSFQAFGSTVNCEAAAVALDLPDVEERGVERELRQRLAQRLEGDRRRPGDLLLRHVEPQLRHVLLDVELPVAHRTLRSLGQAMARKNLRRGRRTDSRTSRRQRRANVSSFLRKSGGILSSPADKISPQRFRKMRRTMLRAAASAAFFAAAAALSAAEYVLDVDSLERPVLGAAPRGLQGHRQVHALRRQALGGESARPVAGEGDGRDRNGEHRDRQRLLGCEAPHAGLLRRPEISRRSASRAGASGRRRGAGRRSGALSIHGVTREITLPFEIKGRFDGPHPDDRIGISATFSFDRREFGMAWDNNPEAKVVGTRVTVDITLLATRVAAKK